MQLKYEHGVIVAIETNYHVLIALSAGCGRQDTHHYTFM